MTGLKVYTEETTTDAFAVISERFSPAECPMAEKYLTNPLRTRESFVGDIAYEDDVPVGFQAAILRRLYEGKVEFFGVVGGMLGMKEGSSPVLLVNLMKASIASRGGSVLFYANTANPTSVKMNRMLGVKGCGPWSCEHIRFAVTYWPRLLAWMLPAGRAVQLTSIDPVIFDRFWSRYLEHNKGIVTSRTAEELNWVFGDRLQSGECVLFAHLVDDEMKGYIIIKSTHGGKRWLIVDWIALNDDAKILKSVLKSAVRYVRKQTSAIVLESIGFPDHAQPILKFFLPFCRKAPSNSFLWKFTDGRKTGIPEGSWFYGPYDGDRCM